MTSPIPKVYSAVSEFFANAKPANIVALDDQARVQAYDVYEAMYWNDLGAFKIVMRGDNSKPIYLPSVRKVIEATNRFLAVDFDYAVDPAQGTPEERAAINLLIENLFKREKVFAKFNNNRRYGLIKGDAIWHIRADDRKAEGSRVQLLDVPPENYFPIWDIADPDRMAGVHLVDIVQDPRTPDDKTKKLARRQTYRKDAVSQTVTTQLSLYEIGKWDDRNLKPADLAKISDLIPQRALPPSVTTIPVYHVRNSDIPNHGFGTSEVKGMETIIRGLNQSISDEDVTLVLQGLGVYTTDAGPPKNLDGTDGEWEIGPGSVIETGAGGTFSRVSGVSTVAPMQDHMKYMMGEMQMALGVNDIAAGNVNVTIAESGISLRLQMSPMLAKNAEKEVEILAIFDHILYDLVHQWFPAYEGVNAPLVRVVSIIGDPLPVNRDAAIQEVLLLLSAGVVELAQVQAKLTEFGYEFDANSVTRVIAEQAALAAARNADPFNNRFEQEVSTTGAAGNA